MDKEKLHKYALNKISDKAEIEEVVSWIESSPENRKEFNSIKNLWSYADFSNYNSSHRAESSDKGKFSKVKVVRLELLKYAAIIIMSLMVGGTLTIISQHSFKSEIAYNEVIVPFGESAEVVLPDKTHVWLSAGSHLVYPSTFDKKSRDIQLTGEALFEVEHNPNKPFHVATPNLIVEVLGTTFNVEAFDGAKYVNVTLVEGNVNIQSKERRVLTNLNPNQRASYNISTKSLDVKKMETNYYSLWKKCIYSMDDETLADIALRLERLYNVKIIFDNEEIREIKFSGSILKNKPIEQIMDVFKYTIGIDYQIMLYNDKPNEIYLKKK
ncbi:FecR family protein [Carboxylicivirga marina]|uniref:FecR family protein n=1 Tax=Carboxylicivirga marina TaxID=2800988 RepID=UPI002593C39A|nr:FecR family protein [uncultured Carboxylicivirga sp.]